MSSFEGLSLPKSHTLFIWFGPCYKGPSIKIQKSNIQEVNDPAMRGKDNS